MPELSPLFPTSRLRLDELSAAVGVVQHLPDAGHGPDGVRTDDVARALEVDLLHGRELGWEAVEPSVTRNLAYLDDAFDASTGRFRGFRGTSGDWSEVVVSEDTDARTLLALGASIAAAPPGAARESATALFLRALPTASLVSNLRPRAAVLLGCDAAVRGGADGGVLEVYQRVGNDLRLAFEGRQVTYAWPWPEPELTSENELPARALIVGGRHLGYPRMARTGLRVLDWLIDSQTSEAGFLSTIGTQGWWPREGGRARFDQRPIAATSLLLAAADAYAATTSMRYRHAMEMAYDWFLGRNDAGVAVAEPATGACHDGFGPDGLIASEGAESTLMWLMAAAQVRGARAGTLASAIVSRPEAASVA